MCYSWYTVSVVVSPALNTQSRLAESKVLPRVLVLVGPTASGKTSISLDIAERLNGEIISADSRQIFKHMNVGTAKPSTDDCRRVKHYFIDMLAPDEEYNSGTFGIEGREIIKKILKRKKVPLVVGGSGLYMQALIDGFFEGPSADQSLRQKLNDRLKREGIQSLLGELTSVDPVAASNMLPTNIRRIIRALEVYYLTGMPISRLQQERPSIQFTPFFAGLAWKRELLYERINSRIDWMLHAGLIEEVRHLQRLGYTHQLNALQTVGYKEAFKYLDGALTYERMTELIKQNSRRYAKRQLTWFRRDRRIHWFTLRSEKEFPRVAGKISHAFLSQ